MALIAAEVPAPTAVVTCILPPVTSPAAKTPGTFVSWVSRFTLMNPPFVNSTPRSSAS
jgi:hypothetical protein